jgi:hypothetical protein
LEYGGTPPSEQADSASPNRAAEWVTRFIWGCSASLL